MSEKLFFKNSQGLTLCGILEQVGDGSEVVIIVHGYSSSKDNANISAVAAELSSRGMSSFRIDLSGCGESEGKFEEQTITSAADDVVCAIKFMEKRFKEVSLFGSSAGGLASMAAYLKHPVKRMALKAPVSDYPSQRLRKYGQKYLDLWKEQGYNYFTKTDKTKVKVNYSFYEDSKKHVMLNKAKQIKCPVLIIHGTKDESVPIEDSRKLAKELPNAELIELEGENHKLSVTGSAAKANKMFGEWFANS